RGDFAAALRGAPAGPAARRPADDRARAPRRRPADAALLAPGALGLLLDRWREPAAGDALGQRRRRQLRARAPQPRRRRRRRAAADGLRAGDRLGPLCRPRALPLLRVRLRQLTDAARLLRG